MKTDLIHKVLKFIDHERYKVIGVFAGLVITIIFASCDVSIKSPLTGEKVNRTEFAKEIIEQEKTISQKKAEVELLVTKINEDVKELNAKMELGEAEFEKEEEFREVAFESVGGLITTIATGGAINIADVIATGITLASIGGLAGAGVDASRKNKIIKSKQNGETAQ